jgi:hypothetical protein
MSFAEQLKLNVLPIQSWSSTGCETAWPNARTTPKRPPFSLAPPVFYNPAGHSPHRNQRKSNRLPAGSQSPTTLRPTLKSP